MQVADLPELAVEPRQLVFPRPAAGASVGPDARRLVTLSLGGAGLVVAFKLQTNAARRFNVLPAQGYLRSGETQQVVVQLKGGAGWSEQDKFLVRALEVPNDALPAQQMWEEAAAGGAAKVLVRVVYAGGAADAGEDSGLVTTATASVLLASPVSTVSPRGPAAASPVVAALGGSPAGRRQSRYQLDARQREILVKNVSTRAEDLLSRAELEELQQLRDRVGPQAWATLQEQARQSAERRQQESDAPLHARPLQHAAGHPHPPEAGASLASVAAFPFAPVAAPVPAIAIATVAAPKAAPAAHAHTHASLTDLLSQGVSLLREQRAGDSAEVFTQALELTSANRVERAQVLVGLGSAHEAAGLANRALDCYVDALRVYDRLGDQDCKESVVGAIANLHADMRDHAMAAAWFDLLLDMISPAPGNHNRRVAAESARERELRTGHVSPGMMTAAKGQVAAIMASRRSRTASSSSSAATTATTATLPKRAEAAAGDKVDTLWVGAALGAKAVAAAAMATAAAGAEPDSAGRRKTSVTSSHTAPSLGSATPHYLAATSASRNARADSAGSGSDAAAGLAAAGGGLYRPSVSTASLASTTYSLDPEAAERRNRAAAALHVKRALEARRIKDQQRGVAPPKAAHKPGGGGASFGSHADDLVVVLDVSFDGQLYAVALPGPLEAAQSMTVREMRERVSFVTGVDLHEFELAVDRVPLSDSWTGRDIGLASRTELDLRLMPGVRSSKYPTHPHPQAPAAPAPEPAAPRAPPAPLAPEAQTQQELAVPAPRRRPPPPLDPAAPEDDEEQDVDVDGVLAAMHEALAEQRRASAQADELAQRASALLGEIDRGGVDEVGGPPLSQQHQLRLRESEEARKHLDQELSLAKAHILDLGAEAAREAAARNRLQRELAELKSSYSKMSNETRAELAGFGEALKAASPKSSPKSSSSNGSGSSSSKAHADGARAIAGADASPTLVLVAEGAAELRLLQADAPRAAPWLAQRSVAVQAMALRAEVVAGSGNAGRVLGEAVRNVVAGQVGCCYIFNLGSPLFFVDGGAQSVILVQVSVLLASLAPAHRATKARAIAFPLAGGRGAPTDLLDPDQDAPKEVSVALDPQTGTVKTTHAVSVKFSQMDDFTRLYEVLLKRAKHAQPCHLALTLENDLSQRRLVFVQCAVGECGAAALQAFVSAATSLDAQAVVLADVARGPELLRHFAPLLRDRFALDALASPEPN
jgi:tetratricopeptide (TPR) repeat protein